MGGVGAKFPYRRVPSDEYTHWIHTRVRTIRLGTSQMSGFRASMPLQAIRSNRELTGTVSITITAEFETALQSIRSGANVLITGKAGTGKSTLLRTYLESLGKQNVLVTAPTGVAALNIDGFTIHRSFGFRPGMYPDDLRPGGSWQASAGVSKVLRALDVLVIDEISMVRADLFDMVDLALRQVRGNNRPFGGVQLVLVGDLLQLPPVVTDQEAQFFSSLWETPYFFSAHCFKDVALKNINLTTVWRQTDEEFIEVLNQVREGSVGDPALSILNERVDPDFRAPNDWVTLASYRRTVEKINRERLDELEAPRFHSTAIHEGQTDTNSFSGTDELTYAVGARVMTIVNHPGDLFVNGSFGTIVDASPDTITVTLDHNGETVELGKHTWEIKRPSLSSGVLSSDVVGSITQFPVILAWAITIHKSQGKTIPKLYINLAGGTRTDGQFYVALSRGVSLDQLRFSAPVERRHIRANNSLVRRIRRDISPLTDASRLVFLSVDGVNFGISDHIARVHAIIVDNGRQVADFGSWINPMSDLGEFGRANGIPSGGLAMAPTLGDFWPLLRRQAAGGIVIGDRLPMLERAVRHQEKGMDLAIGTGYDIADFDIVPTGDDVVTRCRSMVNTHLRAPCNVTHGQAVPAAPEETEGAVYIPEWASDSPMILDATRATASDHAWAAFSGGGTESLDHAELQETTELLSAWAISRGFWTSAQYDEVIKRARRAGLTAIDIDRPVAEQIITSDLLLLGTRVAFTGRNELLGGPADDTRLTQICHDRNLEYKTGVSRTRCDVLVAGDLASMSRKAQSAREYGKPIISQADFEHWYENGPFLTTAPSDSSIPAAEPAARTEPSDVEATSADVPHPSKKKEYSAPVEWVTPDEFLEEGTRVAFRGSTFVGGVLYPHGSALQALCDSLGLDYKQAVTKTRSDVLVTDDPNANDGKMKLAARYGKPLMHQSDFDTWASEQLKGDGDSSAATVPGVLEEESEIIDDIEVPTAPVGFGEAAPSATVVEAEKPALEPRISGPVGPINVPERPSSPVEEPAEVAFETHSVEPEVAPREDEGPVVAASSEADPTPQELMSRALSYQLDAETSAALPVAAFTSPTSSPALSDNNKAAARFKKWGMATLVVFAVSNALGLMGLIPIGVVGIMASFVMAVVVVVFGVQALVSKVKRGR